MVTWQVEGDMWHVICDLWYIFFLTRSAKKFQTSDQKLPKTAAKLQKKCPNVHNCQRRCDFVVSVLLFAHTKRVGEVICHSIFRCRLQYPLEPALVYLDASFMPSDCGQAGQGREIGKALNNSDIYLPLNTSTHFNRKKSRNTVYWGFYPPISMNFLPQFSL